MIGVVWQHPSDMLHDIQWWTDLLHWYMLYKPSMYRRLLLRHRQQVLPVGRHYTILLFDQLRHM
jgi:hypothetical protein